ncbi:TRAP transporter small permease [Marinobacterium sp. MBR-111]|jgi:C4-dicarboxylate transporter DctQ subunit|uniref:TRAP transporter small permease n=1 Tax=Marinobacterium sp. MBR-111 TaxID=3156463 RepID=UPI0033938E24
MVRKLFSNIEEGLISILLIAMTLLVFAEVIARFVFNSGISWAQEITLLSAGWFVLLGASYGVKVGSHIGVDVFVKLLPKNVHRGFTLLAIALCLIYCGLFLYGGWMYVAKLKLIGIDLEDVEFPRWVATSVLVVGFALLAFRFLQLGIKVLRSESDGFHFTDEAEESMHIAEELKKNAENQGAKT